MTAFKYKCQLITDRHFKMSESTKEVDLKGVVKLRRVSTVWQNEQNGLKCTGCEPSLTGRATTGSRVRQRSMRRKPLYLLANSHYGLMEQRDCDEIRFGFMFWTGRYEIRARCGATPSIPTSRVARGRACHLRAHRLGIGTWEPASLACYGDRLAAETGDE